MFKKQLMPPQELNSKLAMELCTEIRIVNEHFEHIPAQDGALQKFSFTTDHIFE